MKSCIPFMIVALGSAVFFILNHTQNSQDEYISLCKEDIFFVSIPENCQLCPNRQVKYIDWNDKSIWACINTSKEEDIEISIFPDLQKSNCPVDKPLKNILGNCYSCQVPYPLQVEETEKSICYGKRYLSEYRRTLKSQICPEISQIQTPEICLSCQGKWIDEKCVRWTISHMNLCQNNLDCPDDKWCQKIHNNPKYQGICRPYNNQNWICSDIEGYNSDSASVFCERQNAHVPTEIELETEKENALKACLQTNIWVIFDEGRIYLDSLKTPFIITDERNSILSGGDNTYALCRKN